MKYKILPLLLSLLFSGTVLAQNKNNGLRLTPAKSHRLYLSVKDGFIATASPDCNTVLENSLPQYKQLEAEYAIVAKKGIAINDEKLAELKQLAIKNTGSGKAADRLAGIFELTIENPTNERLLALGTALEKLDGVAYCSLMAAAPVTPPYDIAPATPLYENQQNYSTSFGVNMTYAWNLGLTGQDINIRDVEYGFNGLHEELNERNVLYGANMAVSSALLQDHPDFLEHGTGVLGILYADPGDYGIKGLAYGANEVAVFPEYSAEAQYNRVYSTSKSVENSTEGDVILFEMQTPGALGEYGPAEYDSPIWDLTKAATDAGIIVIATAGNGAEDLDAPEYEEYRQRGDSGAIMVGAGSSTSAHNRLDFSTYGERVDIQGWGANVLSSGYGDAYIINNDPNQNYTWFSGTSSAGPIVTSCVVVLQSYYHNQTGGYLTGTQLKELLIATGKPQGMSQFGHIGPLPNMADAIPALDEIMGINSVEQNTFIVYPNPVKDLLTLSGNFSEKASGALFNALGQQVLTLSNLNTTLNIGNLSKGVYYLKITDSGHTSSKKIIKE